ncbi:hypothetical protein T10_7762 [Trichinella papuae]|uniref:Uncharacterized protein n=1 Tax=Trichinella papuae TaxID=268474 RepID=A0A0V1M4C0_9BILA|nr:hypothetical protein T10_9700 [Trichinella papuae]KRZ66501.1 hypothetical protein T10_7762 [Trichinella papuae]
MQSPFQNLHGSFQQHSFTLLSAPVDYYFFFSLSLFIYSWGCQLRGTSWSLICYHCSPVDRLMNGCFETTSPNPGNPEASF